MDNDSEPNRLIFQEKPPWKRIQWVRSKWVALDCETIVFQPWISQGNEETLLVKERIGKLDKEHKWELAKKMVNPYEIVYTHDDDRLPPSLSLDQPLSRSYYKMVEILDVLQFFQMHSKFKTAHVAEGPGGFIQAVAMRAQHYKKTVTNSFAMTLRPTTAHVPGWKKATAFLQKNKHVKVYYGADGTGDIYTPENQEAFQTFSGQVELFTADGGFDFSVDYSCQEQTVFQLLVNSSLIGLRILKPGGCFVLKLFDCFSTSTRFLIHILGRCFSEWTLYKPAMTRPCNSERYFIGKSYRIGVQQVLVLLERIRKECLAEKYPQWDDSLSSQAEIDFFKTHNEYTMAQQILSIQEAITLSEDSSIWWSKWLPKCIDMSYAWCENFHMIATPKRQYNNTILSSHTSHKDAFLQ